MEWLLWMHSTLTVGLQIDPQKHWFSTISGSKLPSIVAEANKQHSEKNILCWWDSTSPKGVKASLFGGGAPRVSFLHLLHSCSCRRWKHEEPRMHSCCLTEANLDRHKQTNKTRKLSFLLTPAKTYRRRKSINWDITSGRGNKIVSSPLNLYSVSWQEPLRCN